MPPCRRPGGAGRPRALEAEQLLGLADAADGVEAKGEQRLLVGAREVARHDERPIEALRQGLETAGEVDRRPDRSEVEPIGRADIAVDDIVEMEADAGADR